MSIILIEKYDKKYIERELKYLDKYYGNKTNKITKMRTVILVKVKRISEVTAIELRQVRKDCCDERAVGQQKTFGLGASTSKLASMVLVGIIIGSEHDAVGELATGQVLRGVDRVLNRVVFEEHASDARHLDARYRARDFA